MPWRTLPAMVEFETWADLAQALEGSEKGTQTALANAMGVDPSQFSRSKKNLRPLTVHQAAVARQFFSRDTVIGDGVQGRRPQQGRLFGVVPGRQTRLPVYGHAAASDGDRFVLNEGEIIEERELPFGISLGAGDYFIVLPSGSSMEPRINAGEPQVVRWRYPPARDRPCVIEFTDGTAVIKNYRGYKSGHLMVDQFNPPATLTFEATKVRAIHAVIMSL